MALDTENTLQEARSNLLCKSITAMEASYASQLACRVPMAPAGASSSLSCFFWLQLHHFLSYEASWGFLLHKRGMSVNILEGIAAVRQPITKPAWLARMKRKGGTISTTSAPPQAQGPTQRRRLKSITGFSSRCRHNTEEPFGSANRLQQLRPVPPYLTST